jgi:hypothetical protein
VIIAGVEGIGKILKSPTRGSRYAA